MFAFHPIKAANPPVKAEVIAIATATRRETVACAMVVEGNKRGQRDATRPATQTGSFM